MEDVFEEAADRAGVPEEIREEVIARVREELAEAMHCLCVTGDILPSTVSVAHLGARNGVEQ